MAAPMNFPVLWHVCKLAVTRHNHNLIFLRRLGFISNMKELVVPKKPKEAQKEVTFLRRLGFISNIKELVVPKKPKEAQKEVVRVEETAKPVQEIVDGRRQGIEEQKAYHPPSNLQTVVEAAAVNVYGDHVDMDNHALTNRFQKFNFLTQLIDELEHDIPNMDLHEMNTMKDVIDYFSKPVGDTSSYEDLAKLDLPKNLHMNLEPIRFHPDTDTIFDGKTAFPGRATKVTSVKYKRKYKGYDGGDPVNAPWEFKR